jgi:hypothetical protein
MVRQQAGFSRLITRGGRGRYAWSGEGCISFGDSGGVAAT